MSAATPLVETWVVVAQRTNGLWETRCSCCNRVDVFATADGARRALRTHTCIALRAVT